MAAGPAGGGGGNGSPLQGWAAVLLQGGAFALVVYMVVVLFPQTHKEVVAEREALINTLQTKFDERNNRLVDIENRQNVILEEVKAVLNRIEAKGKGGVP
jgi:hypothetical protein